MIYNFKDINKTSLKNKKIAVIVANFYQDIGEKLLSGADKTLKEYGVQQYDVYYAPGAFEIPFYAKQIIANYDGIITLGAVIRGETPHFDYVCTECARGITIVSLEFNKPISFGVLTTDNMEQTLGRAGGYKGNKGEEASLALLYSLVLQDNING
jgi:6,7-dimethyl-8-ribityllumazine synthase